MQLKQFGVLGIFILTILAVTQAVCAEELAAVPTDTVTINSSQPAVASSSADIQWAWGEVTNLDPAANTVTLKYLDYETDQEKELVLAVDEKTTFENINSFSELKVKDTLSVDYTVGIDNKNIAKNISYEKPDAVAPDEVAQTENSQPLTAPVETEVEVEQALPTAELETPQDVAPTTEPEPAPVAVEQAQ